MELNIRDKRALVTGGSRGVGSAVARALAREGCHVAVCARSQEDLDVAVAEIQELGSPVIGVQADVLNPAPRFLRTYQNIVI